MLVWGLFERGRDRRVRVALMVSLLLLPAADIRDDLELVVVAPTESETSVVRKACTEVRGVQERPGGP